MINYRIARAILLFVGIVLIFATLYVVYLLRCESEWCFFFEWQKIHRTDSFEECVARRFPVTESLPRTCRAGDKIFTEMN